MTPRGRVLAEVGGLQPISFESTTTEKAVLHWQIEMPVGHPSDEVHIFGHKTIFEASNHDVFGICNSRRFGT